MRKSSAVLLYIDVKRAMQDGIAFYISKNGVILTPGQGDEGVLSPRYFSRVVIDGEDQSLS